MSRSRLDQELVARGLLATRSAARNAIKAGLVSVDGVTTLKPALQVDGDTPVEVSETATRYVGRGAHKLVAALQAFQVPTEGRAAVDVGSSTGGFTQVLLDAGVDTVVSIDVGRDQLHPSLRSDPRVLVCEGMNVKDVALQEVGGPFDIVTADLSFISLTAVAGDLARLGKESADWILLVKPQFEVGRRNLAKDGVVLSAAARGQALVDVIDSLARYGLIARAAIRSPILGAAGNQEAFVWLRRTGEALVSLTAFKVLGDE